MNFELKIFSVSLKGPAEINYKKTLKNKVLLNVTVEIAFLE